MRILPKPYFLASIILTILITTGTVFSQKKKKDGTFSERDTRLSEEYFIEGQKELLSGNLNKALNWMLKCYSINSKNAAVNYKLAECYALQNNLSKSIFYAEKALDLGQGNKYYYILLAELYEKSKNYTDAIKVYEKLLKNVPGTEEVYFSIANLYIYSSKFGDAIKSYNKLETITGTSEELTRQKAQLYLKMNKLNDAIMEWKHLIDASPENPAYILELAQILYANNRYDEALTILQKFVKTNPSSPFASLMLSEIYKKQGNLQRSEEELEKAFLSPQLDIDSKVQILIGIVRNIPEESAKKSSLKLGEILIKVHPAEAKAYAMHADILTILEKKKEAVTNYVKSIELDKSHFKIWQQVMFLLSELNQPDSIIKYSGQAIDVFPSQPVFWFYNGSAYLSKKEYAKAVEAFEQGKKITVSNPELLVQFNSQLGDSYNGLKDYQKSDNSYEDALKIDPNNTYVLNNYSYFLSLRWENLAKAKSMCEKLIQKSPDEPAYLDTFGWVLYELKDFVNAKKYIEKAAEKSADGTILEHLGDVHYQLGNKDLALEYWKKAKASTGYSDLLDKKISNQTLYE